MTLQERIKELSNIAEKMEAQHYRLQTEVESFNTSINEKMLTSNTLMESFKKQICDIEDEQDELKNEPLKNLISPLTLTSNEDLLFKPYILETLNFKKILIPINVTKKEYWDVHIKYAGITGKAGHNSFRYALFDSRIPFTQDCLYPLPDIDNNEELLVSPEDLCPDGSTYEMKLYTRDSIQIYKDAKKFKESRENIFK